MRPGDLLREADRHGPVPAALVPGRRAADRASADPGGGSGLQLTLDFGAVNSAGPIGVARGDGRGGRDSDGGDDQPRVADDPPRATRGRARRPVPGRACGPGAALSAWLAAQPSLAVGVVFDDPRPRRGTPIGVAVAGADGRLVAAAEEGAVALAEAIVSSGPPLVGHEVKPLLAWALSLATRRPRPA